MSLEDCFTKLEDYSPKSKPRLRCIGRLTHNHYMYKDTLRSESKFSVLKRKSQLTLQDLISDDTIDVPELELANHPEGLYEIILVGSGYYTEYGEMDDYKLRLVPYKEVGDEL